MMFRQSTLYLKLDPYRNNLVLSRDIIGYYTFLMKNLMKTSRQSLPADCDYLVVGGGSAGAIIARRLADAGIGNVVLLEAGINDEGDAALQNLSLLESQSNLTEWGFLAYPIAGRDNRIHYSRAKMLGGCGNHNDCAFLVPPDSDFKRWHDLGARGWDAASLQHYFRRVESMVHVEKQPPVNPESRLFIEAAMELGLKEVNFRKSITEGVGPFPLNSIGDLRQSSSVAYLHPVAELPDNLDIYFNTRATKIMFEGTKATGITTNRGNLKVNGEIILAAGAIQSPQLLMLSGIGDQNRLAELDISPIAHLPGVGNNLVDHSSANLILALNQKLSPWTLTCCEVTMLLQSSSQEPAPDILYHFVLGGRDKYEGRESNYADSVKISPNVTRPKSRGKLELVSDQISDSPRINLNYFSDPEGYDMTTLIRGLRWARKLAETEIFSERVDHEILPGPELQSDEQFIEYILSTCETVYHPSGTCKMGNPDAEDTVVTPDLKLKGLDKIRVCDASIFPDMVTVNINNTVMMVAEKAADLIIQNAKF